MHVICYGTMLSPLGPSMQGVVGAATGAGVIIGAYFAFYSSSKQFLRRSTALTDGELVFCRPREVVDMMMDCPFMHTSPAYHCCLTVHVC